MRGKLYLIPNTLGGETLSNILPQEVIDTSTKIRFFAVEELRSARRLLRKMDREFPIDSSTFIELNKRTEKPSLYFLIQQLKKGIDVGIISEAGCPGIADPGAVLVAMAHEEGIEVSPLVGPSSILLALIGSGFSGQKFTFHGYLPKEKRQN